MILVLWGCGCGVWVGVRQNLVGFGVLGGFFLAGWTFPEFLLICSFGIVFLPAQCESCCFLCF